MTSTGGSTGSGRGRPRSESAGAAILAAARQLVAEGGYDALTIEGVAAQAGVGKATVYRRYASRAELVIDAVVDILATAVPGEDRGSLRADLDAVLDGLTSHLVAPVTGVLLRLLTEALRNEETRQAIEERLLAQRREVVAAMLARATARGELTRSVDPDTLLDIVGGALLHRAARRGGQVDDVFRHQLHDLVVAGLTEVFSAI